MKRDVALAAISKAYDRILSADEKFLSCTDLAIAMEVELDVGWKYDPRVLYRWDDSNANSHHRKRMCKAAYMEVYTYYVSLIKDAE